MIIVLVGVPGSGKSTVLKALLEEHPKLKVVNYGEMMLKGAVQEGLDRDALRKLPVEKQQEIGRKAAIQIAKEAKGITLLDTHACIRTNAGYCPGLPLPVLNEIKPKALAMIECPPRLIIERRMMDKSRSRDEETEHELALHQDLSKSYLAAASTLTGAILCIIENTDRPIEENMRPLANLIRSLQNNS